MHGWKQINQQYLMAETITERWYALFLSQDNHLLFRISSYVGYSLYKHVHMLIIPLICSQAAKRAGNLKPPQLRCSLYKHFVTKQRGFVHMKPSIVWELDSLHRSSKWTNFLRFYARNVRNWNYFSVSVWKEYLESWIARYITRTMIFV